MVVKIHTAGIDFESSMESAWEATTKQAHMCMVCGTLVMVSEPTDIRVVSQHYMRADCPVCKRKDGIVITAYNQQGTYLNQGRLPEFIKYIEKHGARGKMPEAFGLTVFSFIVGLVLVLVVCALAMLINGSMP